jgi:hypothetical protein
MPYKLKRRNYDDDEPLTVAGALILILAGVALGVMATLLGMPA